MSNTTSYNLMVTVAEALAQTWAPDRKAKVAVAEDPAHALDLLTSGSGSSGGCSVVLFYLSDAKDGDEFEEDTRLVAQLRIGLVQNPGLVARDNGKVPAVLALTDSLKAWAAATPFAVLGNGFLRYAGMTHIPAAGGSALHGYAMTFEALYAYEPTED